MSQNTASYAQPEQVGSGLPLLYQSDATHGWSIGMRAVSLALLQTCIPPPGIMLEIGCGGGAFLRALQMHFPNRTIIGTDLHALAVAYAQNIASRALLYQGDAAGLPFANNTIAAILALDALDQVDIDPAIALREARRVLKPGGVILARVSAHPWLFGPHDTTFNTRQRYSRAQLHRLFRSTGFHIRRTTYCNTAIGLFAVVPRLLQRANLLSWKERQSTEGNLARNVLAGVLRAEARWLHRRNLPFGLSIYLIATRP
jgi:ubiquinone/menaquinone biosynthesis C-methylase UbiE